MVWTVITLSFLMTLVDKSLLCFTCPFYYAGCVGLLLETINPFLEGSSPILNHALRIVEVLGAYRSVIFHEIALLISFL